MSVSPLATHASPVSASQDATVLFRTTHRIAHITLNRPKALNALDHSMIEQIAACLERCRHDEQVVAVVIDGSNEKAFCAGGDVRALLEPGQDARAHIERFFVDEYRLDYAIHRFPKPIVAIMDAVTMGGGMGLSQGATLRVATDRSRIAMPETKIGLTPDVGATHFLNRMPIDMALYVGLTGVTLSGSDAVACGLADICVPHAVLYDLESRLSKIDIDTAARSRDALLTALRDACAPTDIAATDAIIERQRPWIARHFQRDASPMDIVASLDQALAELRECEETADERAWLTATRTALTQYSPTMIHVTREALLRGRDITLADSFRMEMGIVIRSIEEGDFREGVRAHLIDKDRAPKWKPDTLAAVTHERIEHFLASPWPDGKHPLAELGSGAAD